ncbi:hypothetical protein [Clostridium estertheticum]|uniref:Serine protease n=1 Tax=Clostridium estertheticum TaxID=238834 RepID=A0A7Y3WSQ6_9CLOT|nr:hypothetical protein [Clostridium estertheticum]NNU76351.1 hypothetical protein [Clostridium estertheticum]WBL45842.1 hypothetical protein LOR37_14260 [Clostridium estertheticum]
MLSKNVVLIETIESMGTGFLYPCKFDGNKSKQYFIIFTNAHVLQTIGVDNENIAQNYKNQIRLHFYDDLGNKIDSNDIDEIRVYNSGSYIDNKDDIAAILVAVNEDLALKVETNICNHILDNRTVIYMEGYPGIMLEDEVCSKIQLQGLEKKIFPENKEIGIYQITDDYHWYNDFHDRQLLQGMSGSPVYLEKNGKTMLLGINQSISDISQGENPFKLMYYIKIEYLLNYLREANCIIFSKVNESTYNIVWIYELYVKRISENEEKNVTLMLMGGSGAGKSSFAKDFAYHGNQLKSTNDGQTTRTKVIYEYGISVSQACAEIKFLNQDAFCEKMIRKMDYSPIKYILVQALDLEQESARNENTFLENCYRLLEKIYKEDKKNLQMFENVRAIIQGNLGNEEKLKCYEDIIDKVISKIPVWFVKYTIDANFIEKIRAKYIKDYSQEIIDIEYLSKHDNTIKLWSDENKVNIIKIVKNYCKEKADKPDEKFSKFQTELISKVNRKSINKYTGNNNRERSWTLLTERLKEEAFLERYFEAVLECEGFFNVKEFEDVLPDGYRADLIKDMKQNIFTINGILLEDEIDNDNRINGSKIAIKILKGINDLYKQIHRDIKAGIKNKYGISEIYKLDLSKMTVDDRQFLQKCLQVTTDGSLTGFIDYVKIQDMISNEYAMILWELGIDKIKMVDTCGLDHIEINSKKVLKDNLLENLYYYENQQKIQFSDISILYIKKLDSGKPDELRTLLPCVREAIPTAPLYCVFSGIDIFYRTPEEIASICWKKENKKLPKVVNYILSKKGRNDLQKFGEEDYSEESMYLVLKNNLIPYCGIKKIVKENFQYYLNNTKYVRKLLASIVMKEYSSLEIIDVSKLNKLNEKLKHYIDSKNEKLSNEEEHLVKCVDELQFELFSQASLDSDSFRYNTKRADVSSFNKNGKAGYYGTYRHQLNQLFHEAYSSVFMNKEITEKITVYFQPSEVALKAALRNMENKYLGDGQNLLDVDLEESKKNKFRKNLELMYEMGIYKYKPYMKEITEDDIKEKRDVIFNDIFDLRKGLSNEKILFDFVKEFLLCLELQINEDNKIKSENLLKLNQEFTEALAALKHEYVEKYLLEGDEISKERVESKFKAMMEYYFKGVKK